MRGASTEDLFAKEPVDVRDSVSTDKDKLSDAYALLATGSADPYLYVYSMGVTEVK
jgi:COMPASS component SWD3